MAVHLGVTTLCCTENGLLNLVIYDLLFVRSVPIRKALPYGAVKAA